MSRVNWVLGRRAEAEGYAAEAVTALKGLPPSPELAIAYSNRAQLHMLADDYQQAVLWGSRAIELAEKLDATETLVHALNNVGSAEMFVGKEGGRIKLEESLRLALANDLQDHDGPVMPYTPNVYYIWYGCWTCGTPGSNADAQAVLTDLSSYIGLSPYLLINTTYQDFYGEKPNGGLFFGGSSSDPSYSHGDELTAADIQGIVADKLAAGALPADPGGIYFVIASSDVSSVATGFCSPSTPQYPYHGHFEFNGSQVMYAFIGNAARCPTTAGPQFNGGALPTPNGNFAADAMATTLVHALDTVMTDPQGTGWYDRYGLENADKCQGTYGQTYTTANDARANMRLGTRDFLIQQNWVNARKGYCALSYP